MFRKMLMTAAGVAFLASGAAAGPAKADSVLRVGKAFAGVFDFTPVDVGVAQGFFKKRGLEIKEFNFAGSAKLQQALAADAIDIGLGSGVELAFVARGAPVKGVAAFMGPPTGLTLVVRNDPSLQSIKDLKGKKISVSTGTSLTQWLVRQLSRHEGWGPDGITTVPLGARPAQISALRTGNTDGMAIDFVGGTVLQNQGIGRIILHFGTIVPDFITHVTFARNDLIKDHPNQVRDFLAGWFESIDYMFKHKAETVRIAMKVVNEPEAIMSADYDVVMPTFSRTGKFEPKALAVLKSSFIEMGLLPKVPDMTTLYTERFLPHPHHPS
ncbi:MAG TPA: ABC transporter substrate-binding protein [Stellaceae bacterium]|jgi:NitT/TauT family transport system substrate-binding protein|nr:ABC transporter substrate-binding protein [Stellaceae bacterium]